MSRTTSRRSWLRQVTGGLGAGVALTTAEAGARVAEASADHPRNIVVMVADGMSLGVPTLADPFSRIVRGRGTAWWALASRHDVSRGWMDMRSLDGLVTDSAAASSSWGSGSRVCNGSINVLPDGTRLTPLAAIARDARRRVGLVTTTTVTHATPAGFSASEPERGSEERIAAQYLGSIDVVLGGGRRFFEAPARSDHRDLARDFAAQGYVTWARRDQLLGRGRHRRVLGVFADSHLPYTLDRQNDPLLARDVPTLAEMAQAAMDLLADAPDGFLLQVEGGRVDHAAHANDAAALMWEQLAFDDALDTVLRIAETRRDTLVVVTSDHGNANPGLNGTGPNYAGSDAAFARLASARASIGVVRSTLLASRNASGRVPADAVRAGIEATLAIQVSAEQAAVLAEALAGPVQGLSRQLSSAEGVFGQVLGNHTGIGWTGTSHTADLVPVLAVGPGRSHFDGLRRNVDVFASLVALMGRSFRNPSMTPEQARAVTRVASLRPPDPHWV
jgi:alkaline phosphatase